MGGLLCFYGETVAVNGTRYDVIKSIGEGGKACELSIVTFSLINKIVADAAVRSCFIK